MKAHHHARSLLLASSLLAATTTSYAQTWKGTLDSNWTTDDNWDPSGAPGSGADVVFDGSGINLATNFNGTARTLSSLTFTEDQTASVSITTTNAAALTLNPGNVLDVAAGSHSFVGTNGGTGTPADWIFTGTATTDSYTLNVAGSAVFDINGRISSTGTGSTSRNYLKTGTGTLVLSAINGGTGSWNFANGRFTVSEGVLRLTGNNSAGNSGNDFTIADGAAMELSSVVGTTMSSGNGVHIVSGTGIAGTGAIRSLSGDVLFGGPTSTGSLTLDGDTSIGVDADSLTVNVAIGESGGSRSLTKVGDGTLILAKSNSYSGNTTVGAGVLRLANPNESNDLSTVTIASTGATLNLAFDGTDTVTKLFIGTTQMDAGVYGPSATDIPQITGSGTLNVTSGPGFASWQGVNDTAGTLAQDHDNDGVANGTEYFLGGPDQDTTGFTALPGPVPDGGSFSITWPKGTGYSGTYGTDFWIETSEDLGASPWTQQTLPMGNVTDDAGFVKFTFPGPLGTRLFARLVVTGP